MGYATKAHVAVYGDDLNASDIKWRLGPFEDYEAAEAAKLLIWGHQTDQETRNHFGIGACLIEQYAGQYARTNLVHDWTGLEDADRIRRVYQVDRVQRDIGDQTHWSHKR